MRRAVRTILAGLAGGAAMNAMMLLTFRLIGFGLRGGGILLDPGVQSEKLINVWTRMEPIPKIISEPLVMITGLMFFGIIHAVIYYWISGPWPRCVFSRGWRFSAILFLMTFLFWEFFTPFNLFWEPLSLAAVELFFWAAIAAAEGFAIAAVMERDAGQARAG